MRKFYIGYGAVCLVLYLAAEVRGWTLSPPRRYTISSDVRSSPGGYRSYHFWHAGWQGGK